MTALGMSNSQNNQLAKSYWKAFIRLLENNCEVQSCFQIIEQSYIR
jgi:hypothetical protein